MVTRSFVKSVSGLLGSYSDCRSVRFARRKREGKGRNVEWKWNSLEVAGIIRSPKQAKSERVVELVIGNMSGWILQDVGSVARPWEYPPFLGWRCPADTPRPPPLFLHLYPLYPASSPPPRPPPFSDERSSGKQESN